MNWKWNCIAMLPTSMCLAFGGPSGPICDAPLRATYPLGLPYEIALSGDTLFVQANDEGIIALDVSDPLMPIEIDQFDASDEVMELVGNVLYCYKRVLGERTVIQLVDASDPNNMQLINEFPINMDQNQFSSVVFGFEIEDSIGYFSYLATGDSGPFSGVTIIDFSDPMNPEYIAEHIISAGFSFPIRSISVSGSVLYAIGSDAALGSGILVYDLSDPNVFSPVGIIDRDIFGELFLHDSRLYATGTTTQVYDLSTPLSPTLLADFPNIGTSRSMLFVDDDIFVNTSEDGIRKYDNSDPTSPEFEIAYTSFTSVSHSVLMGDVLYGASTSGVGSPPEIEIGLISDCDKICAADFTDDNLLDYFDVSAFVNLLIAQDPLADLNEDGVYDFFDVNRFLELFAIGC